MAESRFMQTVLFGGYERSAVEKRFERMLTQISDLKNELRETKLMLAEYKNGADTQAAEETVLAGERVKLTQAQVQAEKATKKLKSTEEDLAARESEIEELKAKLAEMESELQEKTAKLTGYESGSDAEALSQVFVAAQQSAMQLVEKAKKESAELEQNTKKLAQNLLTEANNTAKQIIYEAEVQAAETVADAENRLNQMETASTNYRASLLGDVESMLEQFAAIQDALKEFQESGMETLAESSEMLNNAKNALTADGIPQFREPVQITAKLPPEPELETIDENYDGGAAEEDAKQQQADELARLQAMAAALGGGKKQSDEAPAEAAAPAEPTSEPAAEAVQQPVVEYADPSNRPQITSEPAEPAHAAEDAASALAALAAQAEAIAGKKKSGSGAPDLAALAAQAAALKKK